VLGCACIVLEHTSFTYIYIGQHNIMSSTTSPVIFLSCHIHSSIPKLAFRCRYQGCVARRCTIDYRRPYLKTRCSILIGAYTVKPEKLEPRVPSYVLLSTPSRQLVRHLPFLSFAACVSPSGTLHCMQDDSQWFVPCVAYGLAACNSPYRGAMP